MHLPVLGSSCKWNYTIDVLLCLAYFEVYDYMIYLTIKFFKTNEIYWIFWAKCIWHVFALKVHTSTLRGGREEALSCFSTTGFSQKRCSTSCTPHPLPSFSLLSNTSIWAPNLTCFLKTLPLYLPTGVTSELFCENQDPAHASGSNFPKKAKTGSENINQIHGR